MPCRCLCRAVLPCMPCVVSCRAVSVAATALPPLPPRMAAKCGLALPPPCHAAVRVVLCCCAPVVLCAAVLVGLRSSRKASAFRAAQATAPQTKDTKRHQTTAVKESAFCAPFIVRL